MSIPCPLPEAGVTEVRQGPVFLAEGRCVVRRCKVNGTQTVVMVSTQTIVPTSPSRPRGVIGQDPGQDLTTSLKTSFYAGKVGL